jgi:kynurenine formamidase
MNSNWIYLSYLLQSDAPAYGGVQAFYDEPDKEMAKGDSCNTRFWRMSNHMGTHIDFPRHFSADGDTLEAYPADFWFFSKVAVVTLKDVKPGQILTVEDLELSAISIDTELLLIKTGFCNLRDVEIYWQNNPGLHPDLAAKLRQDFQNLKVIGFDFISVSSFAHRQIGRESHRAFLESHYPILLMEDMDLKKIDQKTTIKQVIIAPIRVKGADASPSTIFAEVEL